MFNKKLVDCRSVRPSAACRKQSSSGEFCDWRQDQLKLTSQRATRSGQVIERSSVKRVLNESDDLHKRGVGFLSLKEEWANLSSPSSKLLLHILSAVGEFERDLIRSRILEGRAKAIAAGAKFGRKSKLTDKQRRKMQELLGDGKTQVEIAALMGVTQSTISYQVKQLG